MSTWVGLTDLHEGIIDRSAPTRDTASLSGPHADVCWFPERTGA
jgi:hypothetical protein